jgi:ubiquinone/menaquinone biosynthesis C-methylase UbiE
MEYKSPADFYIHLMHTATYNYALQYVTGKRVLDYGCGSGYGSYILAGQALNVQAADISQEAIEFAKKKFIKDSLSFCLTSNLGKEFFDVITSFQVIEHIKNVDDYLVRLKNFLSPSGILLLSTPDKSNRLISYIQKPWNYYHYKEYSQKELINLLNKYFNSVKLLKVSAKDELVKYEIIRRKKLKWISLPFTLFFFPDFLRITLLKLGERVYSYFLGQSKNTYFMDFTIDDIEFANDPPNPTDLIVICQ